MALDLVKVKKTMQDWLEVQCAPARVIWAEQNAPKPKDAFVAIKIVSGPAPVGLDERRISATVPGKVTLVGQRTLSLSINAFGGEPVGLLSKVLDSLTLTSVIDQLWADGKISSQSTGAVRDVSTTLETQWEKRANLEVTFGLVTETDETVGYISTVQAQSTFESDTGTQVSDLEFSIPTT